MVHGGEWWCMVVHDVPIIANLCKRYNAGSFNEAHYSGDGVS